MEMLTSFLNPAPVLFERTRVPERAPERQGRRPILRHFAASKFLYRVITKIGEPEVNRSERIHRRNARERT